MYCYLCLARDLAARLVEMGDGIKRRLCTDCARCYDAE